MTTEATSKGSKLAKEAIENPSDQRQPTPAEKGSLRFRLNNGESPITNFAGSAAEQWKFTALVTGGQTLKGGDMVNREIDLHRWYVHNIELENQKTGEIVSAMRCVLVDFDGNAYAFVSAGIIDGLDIIRSIYGEGPYNHEVKLTVQQTNTRAGNRTYNIVPM